MTLPSIFYSSLFGGLFFVTIPTEAVFIHYLRAGYNFLIVIPIFISCFFIAYNINYFIGMHLAEISKKIITTKKFYKVKTIINKYGDWAILGINAIPFFPAQPLSAILGVFKYNRKRFYFYFLLGQTIKHFALAIGYIYLFRWKKWQKRGK